MKTTLEFYRSLDDDQKFFFDNPMERHEKAAPELLEACKVGLSALKDIISAADNEQAYTRDELTDIFMDHYNHIYETIEKAER